MRKQRDTNFRGDSKLLVIETKRVVDERVQRPLYLSSDLIFVPDIRQNDGKVIAAEACQEIRIAHGLLQPICDLPQQSIAGGLTESIVDILESFQIDKEQAELLAKDWAA